MSVKVIIYSGSKKGPDRRKVSLEQCEELKRIGIRNVQCCDSDFNKVRDSFEIDDGLEFGTIRLAFDYTMLIAGSIVFPNKREWDFYLHSL